MGRPKLPGASSRAVEIVVDCDRAAIQHAPFNVVLPLITRQMKAFEPGGALGYQEGQVVRSYFGSNEDGSLETFAGLIPDIEADLTARGYKVHVTDRTLWFSNKSANDALLSTFTADELEYDFLCRIAAQPLGQIACRRRKDCAYLTALIADYFAGSNVAVVVSTNAQGSDLASRIREFTKRSVFLGPENLAGPLPRILICTVEMFEVPNPDYCDVVIFADATSAVQEKSYTAIKSLAKRPRFCFVDPQKKLDDLERFHLSALFGPVIYNVPEEQRPKRRVTVLMAKSFRGKKVEPETALERKRVTIWHNAKRNAIISKIAIALVEGKVNVLRRHGISAAKYEVILSRAACRGNISIVVESTEHGRELAKLLPEWKQADVIPGDGGETEEFCRPGLVIMTETCATGFTGATDIVIRANGGSSPLKLKNFPGRLGNEETEMAVVIDLQDDIDQQAREDTQRRIRNDESQGWNVQARAT